jgi:membrane protease YdiL (CAAX protease family)
MPDANGVPEHQQARLAMLLLSAIIWCFFGHEILGFVINQFASAHVAVMPSAEAFWAPWWDYEHPLAGAFTSGMLAIGAAALMFHMRWAGAFRAALPPGELGPPILAAIILVLMVDQAAWQVIVSTTTGIGADEALLGEREDYVYTLTMAHLPGEFVWSVLAAPIFEEMCFRGLLLGCLLARGWSPWTAVPVVGVAFASIHGQYFLPGLTAVFLMGCLFGWLRVISGGLSAPIIAHGLINGWIFADDWAALAAG